jgi:hypothetical protein
MSCCESDDGDRGQQMLMALRAELDGLVHQTKDIYECVDHMQNLHHLIE